MKPYPPDRIEEEKEFFLPKQKRTTTSRKDPINRRIEEDNNGKSCLSLSWLFIIYIIIILPCIAYYFYLSGKLNYYYTFIHNK